MVDEINEPHKPQFASAPDQARKAATVEEANAAASELKHTVGVVRQQARKRRADLARLGKMALPSEER